MAVRTNVRLKVPKTPPRYLSVVVEIMPKSEIHWETKERMKVLVFEAAKTLGLPKKRASVSRTIFGKVRGHLRVARGSLTTAKKKAMDRAKSLLDEMVAGVDWEKIPPLEDLEFDLFCRLNG